MIMRGRPFGRGPANILYNSKWLASGGEERRREAIRVGVANRKSFGKAVGGRPSRMHNRDVSPGKLCQSVRDARDFGLTYRRIAKRFGIGRTTAWWHDRNCPDKAGQDLRDKTGNREGSKAEKSGCGRFRQRRGAEELENPSPP